MEELKPDENLKRLGYFFKENLYIKNCLSNLAPTEENFTSNNNFIAYQDKVYRELKNMKDSFLIIDRLFNLNLHDFIMNLFENVSKEFTEV